MCERAVPAYAVGARTADALRDAGFSAVHDAGGDAEALAALIRATPEAHGRLLHVTGKAVARDLGDLLKSSNIPVDRLALYEAIPATTLSSPLAAALYARTIGCVLFFSVRTAATFGTLLRERGLADMITSSSALCLSGQIATEADRLPWRQVETALSPTTESLIALLSSTDPHNGG
jgi:uroporphyrinogen-III synthase